MPTSPTPPIELTGDESRFGGGFQVPEEAIHALREICDTIDDGPQLADSSRDWWPLAMHWALAGKVPNLAEVVVRPRSLEEVVGVVQVCNNGRIPLTVSGGRSGVCGAAAPIFGGVVLDATGLSGVGHVDAVSGVVEVAAGTFGPDLEAELRERHGLTVGHFPQSFDLATVGGWIASRGAGQYSTRYGKVEEMVVGLEVVLADGTVVRTGGAPAAATGPDLTQLLAGSEGTLGIITRVWLRAHPVPATERRAAYVFATFGDGLEACRATIRSGATPAVLRLYDGQESQRSHARDGDDCVLLVLDEGDGTIVDATMEVVERCVNEAGGITTDATLVDRWVEHRNDTSALQALTRKGFVVDTMEVAAPWSRLGELFDEVRAAMLAVPHARAATCHLSHSYLDGACLYFTFAATPPADEVESSYVAMWDAGQRAALAHGGNLAHHHGVGINRARFAAEALGAAHGLLAAIKSTLDPNGILNPGKLGLSSPFGEVPWP